MTTFQLHPKQFEIFRCPSDIVTIVAGRGFGKSTLLRAKLIASALGYDTSKYSDPDAKKAVLLIMADRVSCKALHWEAVKSMLDGCPLVEKIDNTDLKISFKNNLPSILLRGADEEGKRLRGFDLVWAGIDEAQNFPDVGEVVDKVLLPALTRNPGWSSWIIGTPDGEGSPFHKFCQSHKHFHYTSWDNPFYSRKELSNLRVSLPAKIYSQEVLAEWVTGSLQVFPSYDPRKAFAPDLELTPQARYLGVDWGDTNPALVVVELSLCPSKVRHWRAIAEWKNETDSPVPGEDLTAKIVQMAQEYQVFRVCVPDDRPAAIRSLILAGWRQVQVVPRNKPTPLDRRLKLDSLFHQGRLDISQCPNLQSEVIRLRYKSLLDPTIPKTLPNHLVDALGHSAGYLELQLEVRT